MEESNPNTLINHSGEANLKDMQTQINLLRDLVTSQHSELKKAYQCITDLQHKNQSLSKQVESLTSEIRRLKKLKTKPSMRASKMNKDDDKTGGADNDNNDGSGKRPGSDKRSKHDTIIINKVEIIKAVDIPHGSKFKGYKKYTVQGIAIQLDNRLFKLERWQLPDGTYKVAELPEGYKRHHFSPELRAYILHQHHHQGVTQQLLLAAIREIGVDISSGQLNSILIESKETFHAEKKDILTMGLAVSKYIQVDDTGARHDGKNGFCTHIGNELFAWFESTGSKSRVNFLNLLSQSRREYIINEHALAYMERYKLAPKYRTQLSQGEQSFITEKDWFAHLTACGIISKHTQRIATEGALIGSILHRGFSANLVILSDDAGQFNIFMHALCWIHAERKINELITLSENNIEAVEDTRSTFWEIYKALKAYKIAPNIDLKKEIEQAFDKLCTTKTCYGLLNSVLKRMKKNKQELLLVLDRPEIPLHNNLSENDIREYVKKRKISGSTRSEEGRRCRDTFTSLKKTCKKLGVKFWDYLNDRVSGANAIPRLSILMEQRVLAPNHACYA
jgi:hypothetical protein